MNEHLVAYVALAFAFGYALGVWFVDRLMVAPLRARIDALQASLGDSARAVDLLIAENQQLRREVLAGAPPRPRMPVGSLFHRN